VQAAIAAAHVVAPSGAETPWHTIAALYAELEALGREAIAGLPERHVVVGPVERVPS
jgi:predicted RNA polymerase sigma factor